MSTTTTAAPAAANARALARPMPRPAPVTSAVRPSSGCTAAPLLRSESMNTITILSEGAGLGQVHNRATRARTEGGVMVDLELVRGRLAAFLQEQTRGPAV